MDAKRLVRIAIFTSLTCVLSQIVIPISAVPISLSTFAVYIAGVFLSPKDAFISQLVYILLGLIGIPVFSNFGAGIGHLAGVSGGFIISYPFVAYISSIFSKKNVYLTVTGFIIATFVCYSFGIVWMYFVLDSATIKSLIVLMSVYYIGDGLKILVATIVAEKLYKKSTF